MKKDTVLISVLMPAYNCEAFIEEAINSILNQSYPHFEFLIADDKSTDRTKEIITSYKDPRIKCFHNDVNSGYLKTSNMLCKKAQGDYITFQDADDYSVLDRFEILLNEFKLDSTLSAVGSFVTRVSENGIQGDEIELKQDYDSIKQDLPKVFNCIGSSLILKKEVIDKIGLYHLFFDRIGSEDLYWFGLVAKRFKVINLKRSLYIYRVNSHSVSQDQKPSLKKQMSKEFASYGVIYFERNETEIFDNKYQTKVLELFLEGKALLWRDLYLKGVLFLLASILMHPFTYKERYRLLRVYAPKLLKFKKTNIVK